MLVAPLVAPVVDDLPQIGGAQALLADLCRGLSARGHEIVLIAARGSAVRGTTVVDLGIDAETLAPARFRDDAPQDDVSRQADAFKLVRGWLLEHTDAAAAVHAHAYDAPSFDLLQGLAAPVVHTLHLPPVHRPVLEAVLAAQNAVRLVTVSKHNARLWREGGVRIDAVIPNGIDIPDVPIARPDAPYLLFAGRLTAEKGPDLAIRFAAKAGLPLVLVGGIYDAAFYAERIAPYVVNAPDWQPGHRLGPGATYLGPQPREVVSHLMSGATATLMPAQWDEPFGLVAIESQAAGCPVVAFARGGLAEVIDSGRTGWLIAPDDEPAFVKAISQAGDIDRAACRAWVIQHYSLDAMVSEYESVYRQMVEQSGEGR